MKEAEGRVSRKNVEGQKCAQVQKTENGKENVRETMRRNKRKNIKRLKMRTMKMGNRSRGGKRKAVETWE